MAAPPRTLLSKPMRAAAPPPPPPPPPPFPSTHKSSSKPMRVFSPLQSHTLKFIVSMSATSRPAVSSATPPPPQHSSSSQRIPSDSASFPNSLTKLGVLEEYLDKVIYRFRFLAFMGVLGSLIGSFLCFIKGCTYVVQSFMEYSVNRSKVVWLLVEAIDVYLLGTVMLVFGMGLYELFISNLDTAKSMNEDKAPDKSNLFGMFILKERPKWLDITTVNELKTKLGRVIVMLLLIGLFEKSKKAVIQSPLDLLCFSASILLSSSCLFLLSKLND